ncbi:MAG: hypothetical protein HY975_02620 [Candidatus Kerfeldbacteria bacterium]|nr:hypothetical protein [Candidatus Kerfeldbacteria bacterium]
MTAISDRQQHLLRAIIEAYTDTAKPVSSGELAGGKFNVSPATLRNDMVALEEAGYLNQPHTSAGRIPTETAWRWYVQQVKPQPTVGKHEQEQLQQVARHFHHSEQELLRHMAKVLAQLIEETVIVAFDKHDTYYTGLSNLFQQPEFEHVDVMQSISHVVDHLDETMAKVYEQVDVQAEVKLGRENPFNDRCGSILVRYRFARRPRGVLGVLGPMRQDYSQHLALVSYAQHLVDTV